jgi:hypothetical protein
MLKRDTRTRCASKTQEKIEMKNLLLLLLTILFLGVVSCTTDNQAHNNFKNCLNSNERQAYLELVELCDDFIKMNYPNYELDDGYLNYQNDLALNEPTTKIWKVDTLRIEKMSKRLKKIFGDTYHVDRCEFSRDSRVVSCLKENSTSSAIDKFIEGKEQRGSSGGPMIVASGMKAHNTSPTNGLNKTIFVTEVVWRLLYLNSKR